MMLYLTGAPYSVERTSDNTQTDPAKSLGGFLSSTPAPSGVLNALFGEVTIEDMMKGKSEIIALGLINEFDRDVKNVNIEVECPEDGLCRYEICAVSMSKDKKMESISDRRQEPLISDFYDATNKSVLLSETLPSGSAIGIWVKRIVGVSDIETDEQMLIRHEKGIKNATEESVTLTINFD